MTFSTPSCSSVARGACAKPGGNAIAPAAMIAPWPTIRRGTDATVPMPPGLVSVNVAPVCSSTDELVVARLGDELFVGGAERREVEAGRVLEHRHDQEARTVFLLRVDGQAEVNAGFDLLRLALDAAERRGDRGLFLRGARERERDDVGERDLLGAAGLFEGVVQLGAALFHCADVERAERRRDGIVSDWSMYVASVATEPLSSVTFAVLESGG